jgi:hypothetical protein
MEVRNEMKNMTKCTHLNASIYILIALLLSLIATGCTSTTASSNTVTITYWTHVNPPVNKVEQQLIAHYEALHPNVKITYLPVDISSLSTKLTTAFAGGSGPDIFNYFQSYAPALEQRGLIAPIDYTSFGVKDENAFAARYLTFLASWNNFVWPLLVVQSPDYTTVPLGLALFRGTYATNYTQILAASLVAAAPVVLLYLVMQRQIIASFISSGIKG